MKALKVLVLRLALGAMSALWPAHGADWRLVPNRHVCFDFQEAIGDWVLAVGSGASNGIPVDVNQDGVLDFVLQATDDNSTAVWLLPLGGNQVLSYVIDDLDFCAAGCPGGTWIDSHTPDGTSWCGQVSTPYGPPIGALLYYDLSIIDDPGQTDGYFGGQRLFAAVRILEPDGWHYGALDIEGLVTLFSGVLYQIGYESQAGVGILTIPEPPALIPLAPPAVVRPGQLRLSWQSAVGQAYQVQAASDLSALCWTNLDFQVIGTSTNTMADVPITGGARFFRVVVVP